MPRKRRQSAPNHERWLVSYADFITLLFAFFVVMFATAQTDSAREKAVSESVKNALQNDSFKNAVAMLLGSDKPKGRDVPPIQTMDALKKAAAHNNPTLAELMPILEKELQREIQSRRLSVHMTSRGLTISFTQAALFPSGEDEIAPDFYPTIQTIADAMNQVRNPARAEGHTDSVPIHNSKFRSNWELSAARSIALAQLLIQDGVARDRLSIAGYADTDPIDTNDTAAGREKNRRVDIVILNAAGAQGEPERSPPAGK
ncbi:MAG TPA: flagellar motor protein MotB [Bryobacteraceae bacterium]|nr:flagellar motor protein MotB [Bryobacteraceae bacterium]